MPRASLAREETQLEREIHHATNTNKKKNGRYVRRESNYHKCAASTNFFDSGCEHARIPFNSSQKSISLTVTNTLWHEMYMQISGMRRFFTSHSVRKFSQRCITNKWIFVTLSTEHRDRRKISGDALFWETACDAAAHKPDLSCLAAALVGFPLKKTFESNSGAKNIGNHFAHILIWIISDGLSIYLIGLIIFSPDKWNDFRVKKKALNICFLSW